MEIYTSADHASFHRDFLAGSFDLLITGPHFGVMYIDQGNDAIGSADLKVLQPYVPIIKQMMGL